MSVTLYGLKLSHPAHAAHLALEHKRIDHRVVNLMPGLHPQLLGALGFEGKTVPALLFEDGRRVQGSLEIPQALEALQPEPSLYPADPEAREAVSEAERWGHDTLQDVPRRLFRWATAGQSEVRIWIGTEIVGLPTPAFMDPIGASVARGFARVSDATDEHVRGDIAELPALLDRVDALIAEGTIGGSKSNAAEFQIGASVRVLMAFPALRPLVEGRPSGELAMRLLPAYPDPIPAEVPAEWVAQPAAAQADPA